MTILIKLTCWRKIAYREIWRSRDVQGLKATTWTAIECCAADAGSRFPHYLGEVSENRAVFEVWIGQTVVSIIIRHLAVIHHIGDTLTNVRGFNTCGYVLSIAPTIDSPA